MKKREKTADNPILIVDDNPVTNRLLALMLGNAGYMVVQVESGDRALEVLETQLPDLILLDIDMPGVSGLETCRIIKSNPRTADIPVIFVTASDDKTDIVAGFSAGAQDYIIKPSTKEELLARVRTHLALCKSQKELKASRARYRKLSFLDDLTGLHNTRYLYQTLQEQLDKHPEQPVTVAFLDIDSFKHVVDTHGHLNGSRAIAELAAVIRPLLPKGGYGVSYGGDEFVLVVPGSDAKAGGQLIQTICDAIAGNRFLTSHNLNIGLTVSCGMTIYPEDSRTLVDLLGTADHALFEAKRRGKNRVVAYGEMLAGGQGADYLPIDRHKALSA